MKQAVMVVIEKKGKLLGVSRKNNPNDFGFIGGKVDPGESPETALIREAKEEAGISLSNLKRIFSRKDDGWEVITFTADYSGTPISAEAGQVRWVDWPTMLRGSFGKYNRLLQNHVQGMGKKASLRDMIKIASNKPKAVIVEGNREYMSGPGKTLMDPFYNDLHEHLEGLGYSVKRDPGLPYTSPPNADLWVGHSRGVDRLKYAPESTKLIGLGTAPSKWKSEKGITIINHPKDPLLNKPATLLTGAEREAHIKHPDQKHHFTLTDEQKEAITRTIKKASMIKLAISMDEFRQLGDLVKNKKLNIWKTIPYRSMRARYKNEVFSTPAYIPQEITNKRSLAGRSIENKGFVNKANFSKNVPIKLEPNEQEVFNRFGDHHEYMETTIKKPDYHLTKGNHNSPKVLLQERNLLKGLPNVEETSKLKDYISDIRTENKLKGGLSEYQDINNSVGRDITSPDKPRLSRHAIRRITEKFQNRSSS